MAAAERAGLAELLEELPEGLDTLVGERGLTLSGGQRQRVAIARALIAEPRILILDDATSSVDATTENQIKSALGEVMTGRTTFVIAHRLSTIALADEVVVLESGEIVARGHARRAARELAALPRDRREGPAGPGVPHARGPGARGGGAVRDANRAGRLRHLISLLRPYRGRVLLMFVALLHRDRGRAGASIPRRPGDRRGHRAAGHARADADRDRVRGRCGPELGHHLPADVPHQLGRPARAPGPQGRALRAPPAAVDRLLLAQQGGRPDLAADERHPGARPARDRGHLDALLGHAHARRHRGDPGAARAEPRPDHVPDLPGPAGGERGVPARLGRGLSAHAREDRAGHRLSPGDAVRRARGARLRPGAAAPQPLRRAERRAPRGEHEDRLPERGVLPRGRAAVRGGHRGDPDLRRQRGRRRGGDHRRARHVRLLPPELLRPDPVALAALHDLPGRHGRARQDLRAARRGAGRGRQAGRRGAAARARRDPLRRA